MDLATPSASAARRASSSPRTCMEGGNPASLLLLPPLLLVWGATIMVSIAGGTMSDAKNAIGSLKKALTGTAATSADVVPPWSSPRRQGPQGGPAGAGGLAQDDRRPFLVKGVTMAVDGTDPEEMREILEAEVAAKRAETKQSAKFFADAGAYAPTIGIIGTVMGLVHVLENLAQPEELGHLIAAAFLATLWGVLSANVFFAARRQPPQAPRRARGRPDGAHHRGRRWRSRPAPTRASSPRSCSRCSPLTSSRPRRRREMARRRRPAPEEEHENHERWLVTYADMITLLMVLFIVLFAMSQVDQRSSTPSRRASPPASGSRPRCWTAPPRSSSSPGRPSPSRSTPTRWSPTAPRSARSRCRPCRPRSAPRTSERTPRPQPRRTGCSPSRPRSSRPSAAGARGRRLHRHRRAWPGGQPGLTARGVPRQPGDAVPRGPRDRRHDRPGAAAHRRPAADRGAHQPGPGAAEVLRQRLGPLRRARRHRPAAPQRAPRRRRPIGWPPSASATSSRWWTPPSRTHRS